MRPADPVRLCKTGSVRKLAHNIARTVGDLEMRRDAIPDDLRALAFDFFYWFSRFEFALKENRILKSDTPGDKAEPGWQLFIETYRDGWTPTAAASQLIAERPQRQIVTASGLDFREVGFNANASALERVVRYAQTVRNNLFHGGKHGEAYWDDPERMRRLLATTIAVLDDLAQLAGIEGDYRRLY
jgi:hypothetical protein